MLGNRKEKPQDIDALDTLRRWIKKNNFEYGSLKTTLIIQRGLVEVVKIHQGASSQQLKADGLLDS